MAVMVSLRPELETRLREQAARVGLDAADYVAHVLESDLSRKLEERPRSLSADETRLLRDINAGLSPATWKRYRALTRKRRADRIKPAEYKELLALIDEIELANAHRLEVAAKYASKVGKSLRDVVRELGIGELADG